MNFFPLFTNVQDGEVFLCGAAALEKLPVLRPFGMRLRLFCENVPCDGAGLDPLPEIVPRPLEEGDLDSRPCFVVTAQSEVEDRRIAALCRSRNIPVNAVDRPELCSFIFPSLITRDKLCVAISTGGASPAAAVELKRRIAEILPAEMDEILDWACARRGEIYARVGDRRLARELVCRSVQQAMEEGRVLTEEEMEALSTP